MGALQQHFPGLGRLAPTVDEGIEGTCQVRPTRLPLQHRQVAVGGVAVRADHGGGVSAQQVTGHLGVAARANGEHRDLVAGHRPQPGFVAGLAPTGFVDVDGCLSAHVVAGLRYRCGNRRRHVLLQLRDRAEPQVYVEGVGQQRHDVALAQPVGARQQPHPGLHGGTKGAARYPFGPLGLAQHLACGQRKVCN